MSFQDLALPLIKRGIPVIPVQPLDKKTYHVGGPERGTLDIEQVRQWDAENPNYNVGCLGTLDGITILDCDEPKLVARIEKETGQKLPRTYTVRSAGKGAAHLYFRQTDVSRRLGNKRGGVAKFDLRGSNQYVVGPGSRLSNGRTYELFRDVELAPFPDWLGDWILSNAGEAAGAAGGTGKADTDALTAMKAAYHKRGEFEDMFGLGLTLNGDHPTIVSLASYLYNTWEEGCEDRGQGDEKERLVDILEKVWDEYGTSPDGPRGPNEARDIVNYLFSRKKRLCLSREPDCVTPAPYIFSVGCRPSDKSEIRCLRGFYNEADYALFKFRCEETPAWAAAGTWDGEDITTFHYPDYNVWKSQQPQQATGWQIIRYTDIAVTKVDWLWKNYLATGKLTMINGEPGSCKSLITVDAAARVTTGRDWCDGSPNPYGPSTVLILTEEEDAGDTIKPRFLAAGGDPDNLVTLNVGKDGLFQIEKDTEKLRKVLELAELPVRLVILDPVADYTNVDAYKDAEVRPMLGKLKEFGAQIGAAVVGVNHLNKKTDLGAIHRVSGARGWVSFARLNFLVGAKDGARHIVSLKTNIAKDSGSLTFSIESVAVEDIDEVPRIKWGGKGSMTAHDLMKADQSPRDTEQTELEACIRRLLQPVDKWCCSNWLFQEAGARGWSKRSVQRILEKIGVDGRWTHEKPPKRQYRIPSVPAKDVVCLREEVTQLKEEEVFPEVAIVEFSTPEDAPLLA